jgi:hypothetical protein
MLVNRGVENGQYDGEMYHLREMDQKGEKEERVAHMF